MYVHHNAGSAETARKRPKRKAAETDGTTMLSLAPPADHVLPLLLAAAELPREALLRQAVGDAEVDGLTRHSNGNSNSNSNRNCITITSTIPLTSTSTITITTIAITIALACRRCEA